MEKKLIFNWSIQVLAFKDFGFNLLTKVSFNLMSDF